MSLSFLVYPRTSICFRSPKGRNDFVTTMFSYVEWYLLVFVFKVFASSDRRPFVLCLVNDCVSRACCRLMATDSDTPKYRNISFPPQTSSSHRRTLEIFVLSSFNMPRFWGSSSKGKEPAISSTAPAAPQDTTAGSSSDSPPPFEDNTNGSGHTHLPMISKRSFDV